MSQVPGVSEAFVVYHEGVALRLHWDQSPPLERVAILRMCALDAHTLFLLSTDGNLYMARLSAMECDTEFKRLHLELQHTQVRDVDYCRSTRQLFVVTCAGAVLVQQLKRSQHYRGNICQTLQFDPLELAEEGVLIDRVCCAAQGVLFVTRNNELYAMGSCGDVFNAGAQPKKVRLVEDSKELLDLAAGDDYFVLLLKCPFNDQEDSLFDFASKRTPPRVEAPSILSTMNVSPRLNPRQSIEFELAADVAAEKQEINSDSSFSSKSSRSAVEPDFEAIVVLLLRQGYALLNTQVHTFGESNNGLLGTGDHIKRGALNNMHKLDAVGVCGIAAGREHTIARTLDGRLYHWGRNGQQQLTTNKDVNDLSAPTELKLDSADWTDQQRQVLSACCGDYYTVLLNARNEVVEGHQRPALHFPRDFFMLHQPDKFHRNVPTILASGAYTLHNRRPPFPGDVQLLQLCSCLADLRSQLRICLKYRHVAQKLELYQQKTSAMALHQLQHVCRGFQQMIYLLAALLHSLEGYYRGDYASPAELVFIKYYRLCIELYEWYTRVYCDIYAIDGFHEAEKELGNLSGVPLLADAKDECDLTRIFRQPFSVFPNCLLLLEQLVKSHPECTEHLLAWQKFARQQRIELELAESTQDFWQHNERNAKIRDFRRKHRRVILSSTTVPLRLSNSHRSMSSNTFILFSDCLLQVGSGSQLQMYPLNVLWVKTVDDQETALQINTPERSFTLNARSHMDRKLWQDQLESSIMTALGRPLEDIKLAQARNTLHLYSRNHPKYAGVRVCGRWLNAQPHGNCYLEYPDGRVYYGQMRLGEIEGFGKMVIPSAGLYEGHFKAGKFHGQGTYELKENELYEGNFRDGLYHGHGTLRSNYYTYIGEWQANARCGYGVYDDMVNGDKYMGMFADNKRAGPGICITVNGDYFEGMFGNDELSGSGIAVLAHDYYYEGELSIGGPSGKGTYYMPTDMVAVQVSNMHETDEFANRQVFGNILSGQLAGVWHDVRITAGNVALNRTFNKYPKSIGELVVDNNRKWRSLFDDFEEQLYGDSAKPKMLTLSKKQQPKHNGTASNQHSITKQLWTRIVHYTTASRERDRLLEQQDTAYNSTQSNFAKNISLGFSQNYDKLSLKSTNSLFYNGGAKSSMLDVNPRHSHSQETLCDADLLDSDLFNPYSNTGQRENSFNSLQLHVQVDSWANDGTVAASLHSSIDSALHLSGSYNNNNDSYCSQHYLDFVPNFGITSLTAEDVNAIKEYLQQAFTDRHHPLYWLNQRIANCFYSSYGCWKMKPTPILAKQAMREWESISRRMYKFLRKMFSALPEDFCVLESCREIVSHATLLYPIVLSEGIYSTLFVLYANKYSAKDEIYRQNFLSAEKFTDVELVDCLELESTLLPAVRNSCFIEAIETLKQLQAKYSPKAMLTVIELCMQQIADAHKMAESATSVVVGADSMMPLTLFLVVRAAVPHLGAELALLDDLTAEFEMSGKAGYCYTTLKAAYEHITSKPLTKS